MLKYYIMLKYYCPQCGAVHPDPDGECMYECTEELVAVTLEALKVLPHAFVQGRYSPVCQDCKGRHDARVHTMERHA